MLMLQCEKSLLWFNGGLVSNFQFILFSWVFFTVYRYARSFHWNRTRDSNASQHASQRYTNRGLHSPDAIAGTIRIVVRQWSAHVTARVWLQVCRFRWWLLRGRARFRGGRKKEASFQTWFVDALACLSQLPWYSCIFDHCQMSHSAMNRIVMKQACSKMNSAENVW